MGQERRPAVQVLRGSGAPPRRLRPRGWSVPPRPGVSGSPPGRPSGALLPQDGAGGAGLEEGLCPKKKFPGERYSKRGVVAETGRGQSLGQAKQKRAAPRRQRRQASSARSPGSLSLSPARADGSSAALQRARPLPQQPPWLGIRVRRRYVQRSPESHLTVLRPGSASRRVGRPRDFARSAPPPQGWGGSAGRSSRPHQPRFPPHSRLPVGRTDAMERPTSSSP